MAQNPEFKYAPMFQLGEDKTEYYLLTKDYVSEGEFEGHKIVKVQPEALTMLSKQCFHDANFLLRRAHNEQVAKILKDPEASENDKYVADLPAQRRVRRQRHPAAVPGHRYGHHPRRKGSERLDRLLR